MLELIDYIILSSVIGAFLAGLVWFYKLDQEIKFTKLQAEVRESMSEFKSYGNSLRASLGRLAGNINTDSGIEQPSMTQTLIQSFIMSDMGQSMIAKFLGGATGQLQKELTPEEKKAQETQETQKTKETEVTK